MFSIGDITARKSEPATYQNLNPVMNLSYKGKKIFAFADTHGAHRQIIIPGDSDIVICAGDAVEDNLHGHEYDDFIEWYAAQPAVIARQAR